MGWLASELAQEGWKVSLNSSAQRNRFDGRSNKTKASSTLLLKPEQFEIPVLQSAYEKQKPFVITAQVCSNRQIANRCF